MNPLIRAIWPDFDPGATVEGAGIKPSPAPTVKTVDLDREIESILAGEPSEPQGEGAEAEVAAGVQG
jgi:hypothetical protein